MHDLLSSLESEKTATTVSSSPRTTTTAATAATETATATAALTGATKATERATTVSVAGISPVDIMLRGDGSEGRGTRDREELGISSI
jgi:redox-regulated HSP33 family molecular chaperone